MTCPTIKKRYAKWPKISGNVVLIWERSHMTSAAEGGGGFEMLTVADKGGRGSKPC